MRKVRMEETLKNPSTTLRSQTRSKTLSTVKDENSDATKKNLQRKGTSEKQSKPTVKTPSTTSLRSKAPEASSTVPRKSKQESSRTTERNARTKHGSEKRLDGEHRGISTIYMPITSRSTKLSGTGERLKISVTSSVRSTDAGVKVVSSRSKDALIKATSSQSKDTVLKATLWRSTDASVKAISSKDKDAMVRTSSMRSKDISSKTSVSAEIKEDAVVSKKQQPARQRLHSRERRRSRTLSPSEVKVLHPQRMVNASSVAMETFSASLNSSKDNDDTAHETAKSDTDEDYEYEDDFEVNQTF